MWYTAGPAGRHARTARLARDTDEHDGRMHDLERNLLPPDTAALSAVQRPG
jgi:hypothetical protein